MEELNVKNYINRNYIWHSEVYKNILNAAGNGDVLALEQLIQQNNFELDFAISSWGAHKIKGDELADIASVFGQIKTFIWLTKQGYKLSSPILDRSIKYQQGQLILWLLDQQCEISHTTQQLARQHGYAHLISDPYDLTFLFTQLFDIMCCNVSPYP